MQVCPNQAAECDGQVLLGLSLSWLLCYVLTVTDVLPGDPAAYGYLARTDTRGDVLSRAPWFRIPYPGTMAWPRTQPHLLLLLPTWFMATTSAKNEANTHKYPYRSSPSVDFSVN